MSQYWYTVSENDPDAWASVRGKRAAIFKARHSLTVSTILQPNVPHEYATQVKDNHYSERLIQNTSLVWSTHCWSYWYTALWIIIILKGIFIVPMYQTRRQHRVLYSHTKLTSNTHICIHARLHACTHSHKHICIYMCHITFRHLPFSQ